MSRLPGIQSLRAHDRLSREEFERRYAAMPPTMRAELLNGAVFVRQPVGHVYHGRPHSTLGFWIGVYASGTPGVDRGDNSTVRLPGDNEPQPDLLLRIPAERGGRTRIDSQGFIDGAPELVVEIAASSASYDLHDKRDVYFEHGVQEYVVHRTEDDELDWFVRGTHRFERLPVPDDGVLRSRCFPGLWLDLPALRRCDFAAMRAAVDRGILDPEHPRFVAHLRGPR